MTKLEHVFGVMSLSDKIQNALEVQKQKIQLPENIRDRLVVKIHDHDIRQSMMRIYPKPETNSSLMKIEEYAQYKTPTLD